MICRSRLAPSASRMARTRKAGALPSGADFRSPPIGTPFAWPCLAKSERSRSAFSKSNPAKTRTLRRVPRGSLGLVAYGIACMVWQILVLAIVCVVAIAILHVHRNSPGRGHTHRRADASGQGVSHFARFFPRGESAVGLVEADRCSRACDDRAICPTFSSASRVGGWSAFPNWIECG